MRTTVLVAGVSICLSVSLAVAATLEPKNTVITSFPPPDVSCGAFLRAERTDQSQNQIWLAGYLTAFNQFGAENGNVSEATDWAGMIEWLKQECQGDATKSFVNQAFALLDHLESRW